LKFKLEGENKLELLLVRFNTIPVVKATAEIDDVYYLRLGLYILIPILGTSYSTTRCLCVQWFNPGHQYGDRKWYDDLGIGDV